MKCVLMRMMPSAVNVILKQHRVEDSLVYVFLNTDEKERHLDLDVDIPG